MPDTDLIDPDAICASGTMTAAEAAALRRNYYKDGIISEDEANALFAIEQSCKAAPAAWGPLFVEALTDYIVHQVKPTGYVTAGNASWLIERISNGGKINSRNAFDLLVAVLNEARWAPAALSVLALGQVRDAVVSGKGPLRTGVKPALGAVNSTDVLALRAILFASGGDGNITVSRAEAEVLMDIQDAADENLSDPGWIDLYVKAIANHLMAASGFAPPSREVALRQEAWLTAEPSLAGFFSDMVHAGLAGIREAYQVPSAEQAELARLEDYKRAILVDEEITAPETKWLAGRINRDGRISEAEHALLSFIKANSPKIDPALDQLMAGVA